MIIFEFMPTNSTHKSFAYKALYLAAHAAGANPQIWNREERNIYDLYDSSKIDKLIYFSDLSRPLQKLDIPVWSFEEWYKDVPLIADNQIYKQLPHDDNIMCDIVCIAPYADVDKYNDEFYKKMHNNVRYFRYFGVNRFGGHKDCGHLQDIAHSMILSSCKRVLCLSRHFAVNAYLCNKNTNYNLTDKEVSSILASEIIKSII